MTRVAGRRAAAVIEVSRGSGDCIEVVIDGEDASGTWCVHLDARALVLSDTDAKWRKIADFLEIGLQIGSRWECREIVRQARELNRAEGNFKGATE